MPTPSEAEYLTIDGTVVIGTMACLCQNLYVLYNEERRGEDRLIPGTAGVVANKRRRAPIVHTLNLLFDGRYTSDGIPVTDAHAGLRANISEVAAIATPSALTNGTRTVVWTQPSGATLSAACHVGPLTIGEGRYAYAFATLDLVVPDGQFT